MLPKVLSKIREEYIYFLTSDTEVDSCPISDLNQSVSVYYPFKTKDSPQFKNISKVIYDLVVARGIDNDIINELMHRTIELCPTNNIDWAATRRFLNYYREYKKLMKEKYTPKQVIKLTDEWERIGIVRNEIIQELNGKCNKY